MSKPENPPAFPHTVRGWDDRLSHSGGMTLRDYFAGQALSGVIANSESVYGLRCAAQIAELTYQLADAMLAERQKQEPRDE